MPRIQHLLITRFSVRLAVPRTFKNLVRVPFDPLDPTELGFRFRTFEVACLPGVLAQTNQDFTWVLIVDPELPANELKRLEALVHQRPRSVIHRYDPADHPEGTAAPVGGIEWLTPYLEDPAPDYLLTSNLDDDDALPPRFTETVQQLVREQGDAGPPLQFLGATTGQEWDLDFSDAAPKGTVSPWHRDIPVLSVGYSMFARYPDYPFTVMRFSHAQTLEFLNWEREPAGRYRREMRALLEAAGQAAGDDLRAYPPTDTFHDWTPLAGQPVMTNHARNLQALRLYEDKERTRVTGPESFPNVEIDWDAVDRHAGAFRPSRTIRLKLAYLEARRRVGSLKHRIRTAF